MNITRAWIWLMLLSAASAVLAATGISGPVLIIAALGLAGIKARIILAHYLGLAQAPAILPGFTFALWLLIAIFAALAMVA